MNNNLVVDACTKSCSAYPNPNKCLNTISLPDPGDSVTLGSFSTSQGSNQVQLTCGSEENNLNDLILQFDLGTKGVYTVETVNLTGGADTVLQINRCSDGDLFGCDDDKSPTVRQKAMITHFLKRDPN